MDTSHTFTPEHFVFQHIHPNSLMNYMDKIIGEIEIHSAEGIKECFANGVSPNDLYKNEPLINELTSEYARTRRTDEKAVEVFEQLAEYPNCETRWLQNLAMIYIVRQDWGKLKILAAKVEQRTKSK